MVLEWFASCGSCKSDSFFVVRSSSSVCSTILGQFRRHLEASLRPSMYVAQEEIRVHWWLACLCWCSAIALSWTATPTSVW